MLSNRISRNLFGTLLAVSCGVALGADLVDIYRLALRNDPTFEVARYTLKAASEKYPQAVAGLLPTINAGGSNSVTRSRNQFSNTWPADRNVHAWNWSLQLTQPLVRMQNVYAWDEAKLVVEQAQAQYNLAEQQIILRAVEAYFAVMVAREGIKVAEAELAATEEQLQLARRGFEKGIAAETDVRDSRSRVDLARAHLIAARNELDAMNAELGKIVDEVPGELAALDSAVAIPGPQPEVQKEWMDRAREGHPAVRASKAGLQSAEAAVGKARAEHTPTLDLVASYGENYSSGSNTLPNDYAMRGQSRQVGIQFNIPLFAGGGTSSRVTEAMANKYRVGAELEVAKRQAATDARMAYAGVVNGLAQVAALTTAVDSSQSAADGSHAGYKRGIYNNIDVLNAEKQVYAVKRDLLKARYETLLQSLKLKASVGNLGEADLLAVNALLTH
jgi:outer membrane protein